MDGKTKGSVSERLACGFETLGSTNPPFNLLPRSLGDEVGACWNLKGFSCCRHTGKGFDSALRPRSEQCAVKAADAVCHKLAAHGETLPAARAHCASLALQRRRAGRDATG